jgi:hypothetical protein
MELERKHIFLIGGAVLLLTAIGIGIYLVVSKPSDKDDKPEDKKKGGDDAPPETTNPPADSGGNTTPAPNNTNSIQNGQVVPIFNEENELKNGLSQLKSIQLYPKRQWQGGWDYTNVRSTAEVNTESAWYDPFDNLLTTIGAGTPIGKVISETTGLYNSHPYRWFKVKLNKKVGFWGTTEEGFVRADTVTFVPYTKK